MEITSCGAGSYLLFCYLEFNSLRTCDLGFITAVAARYEPSPEGSHGGSRRLGKRPSKFLQACTAQPLSAGTSCDGNHRLAGRADSWLVSPSGALEPPPAISPELPAGPARSGGQLGIWRGEVSGSNAHNQPDGRAASARVSRSRLSMTALGPSIADCQRGLDGSATRVFDNASRGPERK